ncbi:hypothetical protein Pelo_13392 [Pelomyxa schiedti]|nr:hypothetical protein Pelo_13392 [Pelomyxa schiedti]
MYRAVLSLLVVVGLVSCEDWTIVASGMGAITGTSFSNGTHGVSTGLVLIYHSTDGGYTWADSDQETTGSVRFQDTAMSGQYAVICGAGDTQWMPGCAYSSDYGKTFSKTDDTHLHDMWYSVDSISSVSAAFIKAGYWSDALRTNYGVSVSANGGKSWTDHSWGLTEPAWYASFYAVNAGWACGGVAPINDTNTRALVAKSVDGSWSWKTLIDLSGDWYPGGLSFISATTGWVIGVRDAGSFIMKTSDGGNTWTTQVQFDDVVLKGIKMFSATEGFAVGGYEDGIMYHGQLLHTTDGGSSWISVGMRGVIPNNVDGVSNKLVWASAIDETGGGSVLKFVP